MAGADVPLRRGGWALHRVVALRFQNEPAARLRARLARFGSYDTVIVTSPRAVSAFVRPVLGERERRRADLTVWAAGRATHEALRALGFRRLRRASEEGAAPIARAFGSKTLHRIVYPRSDRAGDSLARQLRSRGHRVLDLRAYRTVPAARISATRRRGIVRADLLVVTSPSAFAALRAMLTKSEFRELRSAVPIVSLGERTLSAVRRAGVRHANRLRSASVEGLTEYLARGDRHAAR